MGATAAALRGKGAANVEHFRRLNLPLGVTFMRKMRQHDRRKQNMARHRLSEEVQQRARIRRGKKFQNHANSLQGPEVLMYRKSGFHDHQYAKSVPEE